MLIRVLIMGRLAPGCGLFRLISAPRILWGAEMGGLLEAEGRYAPVSYESPSAPTGGERGELRRKASPGESSNAGFDLTPYCAFLDPDIAAVESFVSLSKRDHLPTGRYARIQASVCRTTAREERKVTRWDA